MSGFQHSLPNGARVRVVRGDLTAQDVDAIVNAANPAMLGGGGVDGAIHRAAGPKLLAACRTVPADALGVRCPPGEARLTPGFDLPARFVIHTVGPVYRRDPDPPTTLARAHEACLALAHAHDLHTLAFPALSCGAYGYPHDEAAPIALAAVARAAAPDDVVTFVHWGAPTFDAWRRAGEALGAWAPC